MASVAGSKGGIRVKEELKKIRKVKKKKDKEKEKEKMKEAKEKKTKS